MIWFTSGTHALDEQQITAFAHEFDPQPFHIDREAAKGTLFRGLVASGWHTAAITMRLQVESGLPIAGGIPLASIRSNNYWRAAIRFGHWPIAKMTARSGFRGLEPRW